MNFTSPSAIRRAEREVEALLSACIDYRDLLIRLSIPDPIAGRPDGLDQICGKYAIALPARSLYGERP